MSTNTKDMKPNDKTPVNQSFSKDCVLYYRCSREYQETQRQEMECLDYCKNNGYNVKRIFQEHISGRKRNREQMTQCLNYIKENDIHYLILSEISRISRSLEGGVILDRLTQDKVCIISLKEEIKTFNDDWTPNNNHIYLSMNSISNSIKESDYLSYRVKSGKKSKVIYKGGWTGGKYLPYGYKSENKKLVVDTKESEIVKMIFSKYLSGWGSIKISNYLNVEDIPTKLGKKWSRSTINQMLIHTIYIGKRIYENQELDTPELRIIDDNLFYSVQNRMKQRKNTDKTFNQLKKYDYMFSGLVKCGVCGKNYYGLYRDNFYKCSSGKYHKGCGNQSVKLNWLEENIQSYMLLNWSDLIFNNTDIKKTTDQMETELKLLQEHKSEQQSLLQRINDMYERKRISLDEYDKKYDSCQEQITKIDDKIKQLIVNISENKTIMKKQYKPVPDLVDFVMMKDNYRNPDYMLSKEMIEQTKKTMNVDNDVFRQLIKKITINKSVNGVKDILVNLVNGKDFWLSYSK